MPRFMRLTGLFCLVSLLLLFASCEVNPLTVENAAALLDDAKREQLESICSLDESLLQQPEFQPLVNETFCEARFIVSDIFYITDKAVNAQYQIVAKSRPEALKKWLDAMAKLEERLKDAPELADMRILKKKASDLLDQGELVMEKGKINFARYDEVWKVSGGSV